MVVNLVDHIVLSIPKLEFKCEHQGTNAIFLDPDINASNGIFIYRLFDDEMIFLFFIV